MFDRAGNYLMLAILLGMILGVAAVAVLGEDAIALKFLGDIFLNALKMVVIPLIFCSMVVGISQLGDIRKLGWTGGKTLAYFLATSSIAVIIGLVLVNLFQPGTGFDIAGAANVEVTESYSFFSWLVDQIPSNLIKAAAETQVLPVIVFALFFGGVLTTIGSKGRPVIAIIDGINDAIMKIVHIIMWFAPIGIFGLVAGQLASEGGLSHFYGVFSALGKYSLVVILGLLIQAVIVLPAILWLLGGKNPIEYLVGMSQAIMTAFATASSSATLPVTMECVEEKNDVDSRSASFVLPLGATINMDGTALYEAVAAMFIAQAYGVPLSLMGQITIFATAVLASIGAAGIPQAGLVTMVLVLSAVGLPLEGIGLILAIDWFLDRLRTSVNVWGDSVGAAVIAATAEIGIIDRRAKRKAQAALRSERQQRDDRRGRGRHDRTDRPRDSRDRDKRDSRDRRQRSPQGPNRPRQQRGKGDRRWRQKNQPSQPGDNRVVKIDAQKTDFPVSGRTEQYSPGEHRREHFAKRGEATASAAASAPPSKPETSGQGRDTSQKQTFGRRRSQSGPGRTKRRNTSDGDERKESKANDSGKVYEVPRFPDKILEELSVPSDQPKRAETEDKYRSLGKEQSAETEPVMPPPAVQNNLPDFRAVVGNEESGTPETVAEDAGFPDEDAADYLSRAQDFTRLDRAILGRRDDNEPSGADTPEESEPFETETAATPRAESGFSDSGSDGEQSASEPDVTDTVSTEHTKREDAPASGQASYESDEKQEESGSASASEENKPADESEDDSGIDEEEDSMMWGRSKQKRIRK